jgi:hypothetical protein
MVDPFILGAGWRSPCSLLLLMLSWSYTLVSVRPFSRQMTTTLSFSFLVCRCCTLCTTGSGNLPSIHRYQLSWLQPIGFLLLFLHDDLCALTLRYRDIPLWYFSSFTAVFKHLSFEAFHLCSDPDCLATETACYCPTAYVAVFTRHGSLWLPNYFCQTRCSSLAHQTAIL